MHTTTSIVELLLVLLLAASVVALLCNRMKIPYTIALVFAGFAMDLFRPQIQAVLATVGFAAGSNFEILTPEVIFTLFLPALLFESSLHLRISRLRPDLGRIVLLAVAGVIIATVATGYTLSWAAGMPLASALVFGALISATDPISVVALFRELAIDSRLTLLVESESLFNDGTAVVLFHILLASAVTGSLSISAGLFQFFLVVVGGSVLGVVIGYLGTLLISKVDESRVEVTLTTIVAYGSYLAAENLHVSGVIATVAAGLVVGGHGVQSGMSARTRVALFSFWEYFAFVINSLVFLLIGVSVHITDLLGASTSILIATGAVIVGRSVTVYGLAPISNRISAHAPRTWNHVLFWGGLHGSVSMALALGLPQSLPGRAEILSITFGVVAFSIVVQGLTMKPLVAWLGLKGQGGLEYERLRAEQLALSGASSELQSLRGRSLVSGRVFEELRAEIAERSDRLERSIQDAQHENPHYADDERRIARMHLALAEKSALIQAVADGVLSDEAAEGQLEEIHEKLDAGHD